VKLTHHSLKDQGTRQLPLGGGEAPKLPPLSDAGSGSLHEKEKARLEEIIAKVNDLFEGDLTEDDQLVCVNNVIKGKLLEPQKLVHQANNTKAQFANSPTLSKEIMNAVMDALAAHSNMSKQAIDSERVREGLKDVLLGPGQLYEALKDRGQQSREVQKSNP
jgi:type I restriction enzyme, R subunit